MRCATSATGSARCGGSTSRKRTGNSARSACQHGRISWLARWSACCLRRTTNRSSPTALTVSVPAGDAYGPENLLATVLHTVFDATTARLAPELLSPEVAGALLNNEPIKELF